MDLFPYICTIPLTSKITQNTTLSTVVKKYTKGQIASVAFLKVDYSYQRSSEEQLKVGDIKRKPGFKIEAYILNEKGTTIEIKEAKDATQVWKVVKNAPFERNKILQRLIREAATKRKSNKHIKEKKPYMSKRIPRYYCNKNIV